MLKELINLPLINKSVLKFYLEISNIYFIKNFNNNVLVLGCFTK